MQIPQRASVWCYCHVHGVRRVPEALNVAHTHTLKRWLLEIFTSSSNSLRNAETGATQLADGRLEKSERMSGNKNHATHSRVDTLRYWICAEPYGMNVKWNFLFLHYFECVSFSLRLFWCLFVCKVLTVWPRLLICLWNKIFCRHFDSFFLFVVLNFCSCTIWTHKELQIITVLSDQMEHTNIRSAGVCALAKRRWWYCGGMNRNHLCRRVLQKRHCDNI